MSEEIVKSLETLQPDEPVIFGGAINMDAQTFNATYVLALNKAIEKRAQIRVGCSGCDLLVGASGCDLLVQQHCVARDYFNVQVYVPSETRNANVASEKFTRIDVQGGFKTRDRAMQVQCKHIVGFLSQYAGAASGTAANIISIAAKSGAFGEKCVDLDGYAVVALLRKHSMAFDEDLQTYVQAAESKRLEKKK